MQWRKPPPVVEARISASSSAVNFRFKTCEPAKVGFFRFAWRAWVSSSRTARYDSHLKVHPTTLSITRFFLSRSKRCKRNRGSSTFRFKTDFCERFPPRCPIVRVMLRTHPMIPPLYRVATLFLVQRSSLTFSILFYSTLS